jgi:hypothetical protein
VGFWEEKKPTGFLGGGTQRTRRYLQEVKVMRLKAIIPE